MAHRHALEVDILSHYVAEKKLRLLELKTPRIYSMHAMMKWRKARVSPQFTAQTL